MLQQFRILNFGAGKFVYSEEGATMSDLLVDHLEAYRNGELSEESYVQILKKFMALTPTVLDVYMHYFEYWYQKNNSKKVFEVASKAVKVANQMIPSSFKGRIEWKHYENLPYLLARNKVLMYYAHVGRHKDVVAETLKLRALNPKDDYANVMYSLGPHALRAGDFELAGAALKDYPSRLPFYYYELGLYYLVGGDFIKAITAFRRGFVENPHIFEVITDCPDPEIKAMPMYFANTASATQEANRYWHLYGRFWQKEPNFLQFLKMIFNEVQIREERSAVMRLGIDMQWEHDAVRHSELDRERTDIISKIDDSLSIVVWNAKVA